MYVILKTREDCENPNVDGSVNPKISEHRSRLITRQFSLGRRRKKNKNFVGFFWQKKKSLIF
jgi:hypothetical protein